MKSLAKHEKKTLLLLARQAMERWILEQNRDDEHSGVPALQTLAGAFVSLHSQGQLRGCIGRIQATDPLEQVVQTMARAAATEDPRFPPVQANELRLLEMEISVLANFKTISSPQAIKVGQHGLRVEWGFHHGLLLPQVATEQNWDAETFLRHTCLKAGLDPEHWQQKKLKIESFTAQVFSEAEI